MRSHRVDEQREKLCHRTKNPTGQSYLKHRQERRGWETLMNKQHKKSEGNPTRMLPRSSFPLDFLEQRGNQSTVVNPMAFSEIQRIRSSSRRGLNTLFPKRLPSVQRGKGTPVSPSLIWLPTLAFEPLSFSLTYGGRHSLQTKGNRVLDDITECLKQTKKESKTDQTRKIVRHNLATEQQ